MTIHKNEVGTYLEKHEFMYGDHVMKRGWGRGYVTIPLGHPILIKFSLERWDETPFIEPIDYWEPDQLDHGMYAIGFSTNKDHNMIEHGEEYVRDTLQKLLNMVNNYTFDDAREEVRAHVKTLKLEFEHAKLDSWEEYRRLASK